MIETCAAFRLQTQSVSLSGGDEELRFSALRLRSGLTDRKCSMHDGFSALRLRSGLADGKCSMHDGFSSLRLRSGLTDGKCSMHDEI